MLDKAGRILEAQQARGLPASGSPSARVRAVVPLLGPLIIGSLIDVRERSLALEARGFSSGAARTAYRIVATTPTDVTVTRLALLALAILPIVAIARLTGALPRVKPKPDSEFIARALSRAVLGKGLERIFGKDKPSPPGVTPTPDLKHPERDLIKKGLEGLFHR